MINTATEHTVTIAKAAKYPPLRINGRSPDRKTVWRWIKNGAKRAEGGRVKLETTQSTCGTVTSHEALERFLQAVRGPVVTGQQNAKSNIPSATFERLKKKGLID